MKVPTRVYIAAPWAEKEGLVREVREKCLKAGLEVTSRWIDFVGNATDELTLMNEAINDWSDVEAANCVLLLNTQKRGEETSGKAVETGMALQAGKKIFLVGRPSNVFHHLTQVFKFDTVEAAIEAISKKLG